MKQNNKQPNKEEDSIKDVEWFSSKLNLRNDEFSIFNIDGVRVEVRKCKMQDLKGGMVWFNAYAELEGSKSLNDDFLDNPTFRSGDVVGVDTMHSYNEGQSNEEKLSSALHQIEYIIKSWKKAIK